MPTLNRLDSSVPAWYNRTPSTYVCCLFIHTRCGADILCPKIYKYKDNKILDVYLPGHTALDTSLTCMWTAGEGFGPHLFYSCCSPCYMGTEHCTLNLLNAFLSHVLAGDNLMILRMLGGFLRKSPRFQRALCLAEMRRTWVSQWCDSLSFFFFTCLFLSWTLKKMQTCILRKIFHGHDIISN